MQFFYQFPQRTERLVLISSGGLGHEVSPLLRGAALPGSAALLRLATQPPPGRRAGRRRRRLRDRGNSTGVYLQAVARALAAAADPGSRRAFLQTLRVVIDVQGQKVSARDRLYLLGEMPTLIVWGERDRTIPLAHGLEADEAIPNCRFETLPRPPTSPTSKTRRAWPRCCSDFLATTAPAHIVDAEWRDVIAQRARLRRALAALRTARCVESARYSTSAIAASISPSDGPSCSVTVPLGPVTIAAWRMRMPRSRPSSS